MPYDADDPRLIYMPLSDVDKATGPCELVRDAWWLVHPERGLVFWTRTPRKGLRGASPQCNQNKAVVDHVAPSLWPWAEIRQIPLVMWPSE